MPTATAFADSPAPPKSSIPRSALAVIAGITALTLVSFALEAVIHPLLVSFFRLPNEAAISRTPGPWLLSLAYTLPCVALGGYVTAWIARRTPIKHAIIYGVVEFVLTAMAWASYPDLSPVRNWIIGMVLMVPAAYCGGLIRARQESKAQQPKA